MGNLKSSIGIRAPLFDRLVDDALDSEMEPHPLRAYSGPALRDSIAKEISDLLNTRCAYSLAELAERPPTVLEYGLPDLSNYWIGEDDQQRLMEAIKASITAYEPRVTDVEVRLSTVDRQARTTTIAINYRPRVGELVEPVTFNVVLTDLVIPSKFDQGGNGASA